MQDNQWHLDKKVPLAIIFSIVAQTLFFTYWGSTWKAETENRLNSLEKFQVSVDGQERRIVILEQQWSYIRDSLSEIKALIRDVKPPPNIERQQQQ